MFPSSEKSNQSSGTLKHHNQTARKLKVEMIMIKKIENLMRKIMFFGRFAPVLRKVLLFSTFAAPPQSKSRAET